MDTPEDFIPENEFIELPQLDSSIKYAFEGYIDKYPEDAMKWYYYMNESNKLQDKPTPVNGLFDETLLNSYREFMNTRSVTEIDNHTDGCLFCKKSWTSTENMPTMTLLCGHKYHTVCNFMDQYANEYTRCIVTGCGIDSWLYIRQMFRNRQANREGVEDILIKSYKKNIGFKTELKGLKKCVAEVQKNHIGVLSLMSSTRNEVLHKHIHNINHLQEDLNQGVKSVQESEQMASYRKSVRVFRKKAGIMFRTYHLSFRELYKKQLLSCPWRIRWVLERHGNAFSYRRLGFRIYPGKKRWKDPL